MEHAVRLERVVGAESLLLVIRLRFVYDEVRVRDASFVVVVVDDGHLGIDKEAHRLGARELAERGKVNSIVGIGLDGEVLVRARPVSLIGARSCNSAHELRPSCPSIRRDSRQPRRDLSSCARSRTGCRNCGQGCGSASSGRSLSSGN